MSNIKTLNPQVFALLHKLYHADALTLHGQVSDVIDTLLDAHGWAHASGGVVTVYNSRTMERLRNDLYTEINVLHRSMGVQHSIGSYPLGILMDYAVGLLLNNYWPVEG